MGILTRLRRFAEDRLSSAAKPNVVPVRDPGLEPGLHLPPPRELTVRLAGRRELARDTLWLSFEPVDAPLFTWLAGQHVSLFFDPPGGDPRADAVPGALMASRRETRIYSIWNSPTDASGAPASTVEVVVKLMPVGRASDTFRRMDIGVTLPMVGPQGTFVLRRRLPEKLVFVATGTGIAPIRPMLVELARRGALSSATLLWGVRSDADLFELPDVPAGLRVIRTLSRPDEAWTGARGRVTAHLGAVDLHPDRGQVYVCGNGQMILDVFAALAPSGLRRETGHIVYEKFFDAGFGGITGAALLPRGPLSVP
ncbi:MAG: FAD-dependent oxidoreductase [Myxococcales bacterium]|nr:FAD-dependent oxidoreductase [Myxococcales bacterium]